MVDKKEVRNIKVFGHGRLLNPETGEYFARFDENGEALVNPLEAQVIKKYHKHIRFVGQKERPVESKNRHAQKAKAMSDIKGNFVIPKE